MSIPGEKISQLTSVSSAALTDVFPAVQTGTTYKESLQQVLDVFQGEIYSLAPQQTSIDMGSNTIDDLADPILAQQAATKAYVDSLTSSIVSSATGTPNQVLVNSSSGSPVNGPITLTLPQNIDDAANVTFSSLKLNSITGKTAGIPITITPSGGTNLNLTLSGTGNFAVNTSLFYVNASGSSVGIGTTTVPYKLTISNGHIGIITAGTTLRLAAGANACIGTGATMVAGAVTVNTTAVATGDLVIPTRTAVGGSIGSGMPTVTISNGVSFTLTSSSGLDTSVYSWIIFKTS